MTPQEFADRHLRPYATKGGEIVPALCPFCHGGPGGDKGTFALNAGKRTYNCLRGSCGKTGTFWQLCREFGEEASGAERTPASGGRKYAEPRTQPRPPTGQVTAYLQGRGISAETQAAYKIGSDGQGNILFPYCWDGKPVFVKFRPARDVAPGERKAWRERDTQPILFGMDLCMPEYPLVIFEGEIDAMSGYEAGIPNCVSIPSGAKEMSWLDACWDWLHRFTEIYLFGDSDDAGREMVRRLAVRLSDFKVYDVAHGLKDANEMLVKHGREDVALAYAGAREILPYGLIQLADVRPLDAGNIPACPSGIRELDKLTGGFIMGDLSVWTGRRGEGKSTLLGQLLLEAVDSGHRVCAYSGELRADRFQYWINLQAAGRDNIACRRDDGRGREVFALKDGVLGKIRAWYRDRFWLYDDTVAEANEEKSILAVFETAAKRYGCTVFMVDNLMTCQYEKMSEADYYRAQSAFVGRLAEFARRHNAHVHLIAHPKKKDGKLENDDVAGAAEITNRAGNVFSLARLSDGERAQERVDTLLKILKNRWEGAQGSIGLCFDKTSRRLYLPSIGDVRRFGWQDEQTEMTEVFIDMPF